MTSMGSSFVDVTVKSRVCSQLAKSASLEKPTRASYHVTASQYQEYHKSPVRERQFCSRKNRYLQSLGLPVIIVRAGTRQSL
jgi:hypothetical protein